MINRGRRSCIFNKCCDKGCLRPFSTCLCVGTVHWKTPGAGGMQNSMWEKLCLCFSKDKEKGKYRALEILRQLDRYLASFMKLSRCITLHLLHALLHIWKALCLTLVTFSANQLNSKIESIPHRQINLHENKLENHICLHKCDTYASAN